MQREAISEQQSNIVFVNTVKKYPCLYNYFLPTYNRKDINEKAWEEVAETVNMSPAACKEKWKNLRGVFIRTLKQTRAGKKKTPYYLAEAMQFLIPFIKKINVTEMDTKMMQNIESQRTNVSLTSGIYITDIKTENCEDDNLQSDQNNEDWTDEPKNKTYERKRPLEVEDECSSSSKRLAPSTQPSHETVSDSNDPVTSFINSLMPELREMNSTQFKCFKRRVLVLIDDITSEIPNTS